MGFTKLDSGIVNSSIWSESLSTRVLWITILAMSDENGFVFCSIPGLIRAANISQSEFDVACTVLESPDKYSRTPDFEGRRIEKCEGGWIILNFLKYRLHSERVKEQTRDRVRRFRDKKGNVTQGNVTCALPSASASASASLELGKRGCKERKPAQDTMEQRAEAFKIEVFTFQEKYPVTMLDGFFSYWTEPTPSKTKMRFELEKTWEMSRRLVTWASRAQSGPRSVPPAAINNRAVPAAYLQKLRDPV